MQMPPSAGGTDASRSRVRTWTPVQRKMRQICRRWQPLRCPIVGRCQSPLRPGGQTLPSDGLKPSPPECSPDPERVLRVLADLRPMGAIRAGHLDEKRRGYHRHRLSAIESEPPASARVRPGIGRSRRASGEVNVRRRLRSGAGRARCAAATPRGDPLLLDAARHALRRGLQTQTNQSEQEERRLPPRRWRRGPTPTSPFPTVEVGEGRPRVPSLYAAAGAGVEDDRACAECRRTAAGGCTRIAGDARLPAGSLGPATKPSTYSNMTSATLRQLVDKPDHLARGRARTVVLHSGLCLQRSVRERYMHSRKP